MIDSRPVSNCLSAALVLLGLSAAGGIRPALAVGACGDTAAFIHDIQGSGPASGEVGMVREIEGVVVGDVQQGLRGFFVQEEDADADTDAATSEGIFVFTGDGFPVNAGDLVRVAGTVAEFNGLTELTAVSAATVCSTGVTVTPTPVSLPVSAIGDFEAFEGMLVTFPQTLYIDEYFNFDRFNEIILATTRQYQPTALQEPGTFESQQLARTNLLSRIMLDDGRSSQNSDPAIHPNGDVFDLDNRFRGGDTVQNVTGILDYAFGIYRIRPTRGANYTATNPRPGLPDDVGGSLKVTSFNTFNYFSTLDDSGPICGPAREQDCRGADDANEFTRQRDKLVSAITTIDADIFGLIEIENHPTDDALSNLVDGLNAAAGAGTWAAVGTEPIGSDAIKVALIYKPAAVTPRGDYAILDATVDPAYPDQFNRPALAQTFEEVASGERFTLVVNHLKSKGSSCETAGDPDTGDGQGNCNLTRKAALEAEVAWLATDPTGSGDPDVLIIGDLNAYAKEDPIDVLTAAGYTDLQADRIGPSAYTYLFDGQLGYFDYALANAALDDQVTGITEWHINADEPDILDYDTSFKQNAQDAIYAPDAYRSSDHDPVIIGLDLLGDSDGDGVADAIDACPDSDLGPTVAFNDCDSEVENPVDANGCSLTDRIDTCPADSTGQLASCVARLTNEMVGNGTIEGRQKGRIQRCAN
ncbi:MAG: ExeM/NucH family extracellular endonuclease [Gammaproteobacteria bacterium]|jgi:hypothetical protein